MSGTGEHTKAQAAVQQWSGAQDLARLQAVMRCAAAEPRTFRAETRTFTTAGVVLSEWRSTQLSGTVLGDPADHAVHLMLVLAGGVRFATEQRRWEGGPQTVHLLRTDEPHRWALAHGTHTMRITLRAEHLPPHLRRRAAAPSGPLPHTKLAAGFAAALEQGVSAAADVHGATLHLTRGLHNLAVALLEELAPDGADETVDLRERILDHIEHHLSDQQLNPRSIADAFSVSLRWVHQAFNTEQTSLARHIRHRRVDAVAEALRSEPQQPRLSLLAVRFGFSGREHLARCFRARYGTTVGDYFRLVLEGAPLPAPSSDDVEGERVA